MKKMPQSKSRIKSPNKKSLLTFLDKNKSEIENILNELDLNSITPIDALNLLHELKDKLK